MMQSRTRAQEPTSNQMLQELNDVLESLGYEVIRVNQPNFMGQDGKSYTVKSYRMELGLEPLRDFLKHQHANIIYLYDTRIERMATNIKDPFGDYQFAVIRCHIVT